MADAEILSMVGQDTLDKLKERDPHPMIRVYGIGHEGEAVGNVVGIGQKVVQYIKAAISKLHDKLIMGTAIFNRHAADEGHDDRVQIGEVVGKGIKTIDGRDNAMAAVYIKPEFRDDSLDVASIEANVAYSVTGHGSAEVRDVTQVTGIALSNHEVDVPGFPGATLLGVIHAFARNDSKEGNGTMTLEELKTAIREGSYKPGDLFDGAVLVADPAVKTHVESERQTEYEHAKRVEKRLGEEREARLADQKAHEVELTTARQETVKLSKGSTLAALSTERKLDDNQKKFVGIHLAEFKTEAPDDAGVRKDMNSWIDGQLDSYRSIAEIFGVKPDDKPPSNAQTPASDGGGSSSAPTDLTDPANNPLIPK